MIRILFLIQTLGGGGAERVLVNLVNNMDHSKYDISVRTMFGDGANRELLSKQVKYSCKKAPYFPGVTYLFRFIPSKLLYKYFIGSDEYDIVVAFMHGLPAKVIAGCTLKNVRRIAWLHCGDMNKTSMFRCFPTFCSAVKTYSGFDKVLGVAKTVTDNFTRATGISHNVSVCYNVNDTDLIRNLAAENAEIPDYPNPLVCSVGRFTEEKGFSRLVQISHRLHSEGINHTLMLIGAGAQFERIKLEANALGENVIFTGFQQNPYKYMKNADIFVCSSYYEGLSTATTEAIILGIPTISTNVSGAKEILGENSEYGKVVDLDDESLYTALKEFIMDDNLRLYFKKQAEKRSVFFTTENSVKETVKHF